MSERVVFPEISEEQYDAFRGFVGANMPDTYNEWHKLIKERIDEATRRQQSIMDVKVDYDEFVRYCGPDRAKRNIETLYRFAVKKAFGKS
jgi:hypothetical protein